MANDGHTEHACFDNSPHSCYDRANIIDKDCDQEE
jgi:hypothetical protein